MPPTKIVKLIYDDFETSSITLGITGTLIYRGYRLNACYDIDEQTASRTITGFNQIAAFYNRYHVTWAKISCTFVNTAGSPVIVGIVFRPVANEATWNTWEAWKAVMGNGFPARQTILTGSGGSMDRVTLNVKMPLWKLQGSKSEYADSEYGSVVSGNPPNILEGFIYMLSPTASGMTAVSTVLTQIRTTQYVKFSKRKLLTTSITIDDNPRDDNSDKNPGTETAAEA